MSLVSIYFLELSAIYIIVGWAIFLVYKGGQLSVAPIFIMSVSAYVSAYLVRDIGLSFGLTFLIILFLGAFMAFIVGIGLARVSAFANAISTIALIFIGQAIFRNIEAFGGARGFFYIPTVDYLLPLTFGILITIGIILYLLEHSQLGRYADIVSYNIDLAHALGINAYNVRLWLHIIAGIIGAIGGCFYAFQMGYIHPYDIGFPIALFLIISIFIGGSQTMWGVLIFVPIFFAMQIFLPTVIAEWKDIIYGGLLIVILILRPSGAIDRKLTHKMKNKIFLLMQKRK